MYNYSITNKFVNKDYLFFNNDIKDKSQIENIFKLYTDKSNKKIDAVLFLADGIKETSAILNPSQCLENNNVGLQNILDLSSKYNVGKFIYLSTYKLYGSKEEKSTELDQTAPSNIYTLSKYTAESQIKLSNLKYNILRPCNIIGSRQRTEFFIPATIYNIINNKTITLKGDGSSIREWLPIEDLIEAIKILLENNHPNETYNVSNNYDLSLSEMTHKLSQILNKTPDVKFDKLCNDKYMIDSSKLKNIGWTPQIKFKDSLEDIVSWYNGNNWWLKANENNL